MGIDYVIDHSCPVKDELSTPGLVELIKARGWAEMVLSMVRDQGDTRDPAEITFRTLLQTPDGVEEKEVSVKELLDQAAALEDLERHCDGCPANALGHHFGCCGYLNYPIKATAEEWLMARLPADLNGTAGHLLSVAVQDLEIDGEPIAQMREDETFFEARKPARRRWGGLLARAHFELTSDQLLQMMFAVGDVQPSHGSMVCLFLGVLPHDIDPVELRDPTTLRQRLAAAELERPGAEDGTGGLLVFIHAMRVAAVLGDDLLVDY